jgi:hypothetical protein
MRALAIALLANNAAAAPLEAHSTHGRELSQLVILKYTPGSNVIDHERIDLDQNQIEVQLGSNAFTVAQDIYEKGAYSKPSAVCKFQSGPMPNTIAKGTEVYFKSQSNKFYLGKAYTTYTKSTGWAVDDEFLFTYPVPDADISYPKPGTTDQPSPDSAGDCWVGGNPVDVQQYGLCIANSKFGCVAGTTCAAGTSAVETNSTIWIATGSDKKSGCDVGVPTEAQGCTNVTDKITVTCTNRGKRTLQGFSTAAKKKMYDHTLSSSDCPARDTSLNYRMGCPYSTFVPYFDYYCGSSTSPCHDDGGYANVIVEAALTKGSAAGLTNGGMTFNVAGSLSIENSARKEFVQKGTSYMNSWMYAIREFEDAIDDCAKGELTGNAGSTDDSVHAWDEGVAFYVGSIPSDAMYAEGDQLKKADKTQYGGVQPYVLANKRCKNFKTCGADGNAVSGEAKVNQDLWPLFNGGNQLILTGNCGDVVSIKNQIARKMTVPLVQGTLRYAFKQSAQTQSDLAKAKAEGGVFAAAVLPQVWKCSPEHAATIYKNMNVNNENTVDFNAVKAAFEACYSNMGITCAEVGGLWDKDNSKYYSGVGGTTNKGEAGVTYDASPCEDSSTVMTTTTEDLSDAALAGIIVGAVLAGLLLVFVVVLVMKEKSGTPMFYSVQEPASKQ